MGAFPMSEAGEDPQRPHPVEVEKWPLVLLMPDLGRAAHAAT